MLMNMVMGWKFYNPQHDDGRRRGPWEVIRPREWALRNGISALVKRNIRENMIFLLATWGYLICQHLGLELQNCKKSMFRPQSLWYSVIYPEQTWDKSFEIVTIPMFRWGDLHNVEVEKVLKLQSHRSHPNLLNRNVQWQGLAAHHNRLCQYFLCPRKFENHFSRAVFPKMWCIFPQGCHTDELFKSFSG